MYCMNWTVELFWKWSDVVISLSMWKIYNILGHSPSDCSWRPTSKASLSLDELLDRHARYWVNHRCTLIQNKRVVTECYHVAVAVSEQNCISIQQGFVAGAQTFALKWGTESGAQLIRGSNGVLYFGDWKFNSCLVPLSTLQNLFIEALNQFTICPLSVNFIFLARSEWHFDIKCISKTMLNNNDK